MQQDQRTEEPKIEAARGIPANVDIDPAGITLFIEFVPDKQQVWVDYDREKIKSWDMALAYLRMATLFCETQRGLSIAQTMQAQAEQQIQEQMIKMKLAQDQQKRRVATH